MNVSAAKLYAFAASSIVLRMRLQANIAKDGGTTQTEEGWLRPLKDLLFLLNSPLQIGDNGEVEIG
jgi:hypothetical protein